MFLLFTIKSCCILTKQWLNKLVCLCFWSISSLNNPDCIWMTQYQSCHKRTPPHNIACFELSCTSYMELKSCTIMIFDLKKRESFSFGHSCEWNLTLYNLKSVCIFSILLFIHFLRCWQGEFYYQSNASFVDDHFQLFSWPQCVLWGNWGSYIGQRIYGSFCNYDSKHFPS